MPPEPTPGQRQRILSLVIRDQKALHAAYMPFIKNGGLFIPTSKPYQLGDDLFVLLELMNEPERVPIAGRVVWVTPLGAEGNRAAGVGIQFTDQDRGEARHKIEQHLPAGKDAQRPTHTM